jgi:hypothetical protein
MCILDRATVHYLQGNYTLPWAYILPASLVTIILRLILCGITLRLKITKTDCAEGLASKSGVDGS